MKGGGICPLFKNRVKGMDAVGIREIYAIEMRKVLKKPITAVLLVAFILPLFYAVSIYTDAAYIYTEGESDIFSSALMNWIMLQYICLPQILISLIATKGFGYELEEGQIKMLLLIGVGRTKLLLSKVFVNLTLLMGLYATFYIFSYIVYIPCDGMVRMDIFVEWLSMDAGRFLLIDALYLVNIFMISNVVVCLSLFCKPFTSFMIGVGISLMAMLLQYFPVVKYFLPMYVANQVTSMTISTTSAVLAFCIFVFIAFVPIMIAIKKFNKIDIK
ncbi:ABC transporter permease [Lachnospiraceae bacterium ZAX-1]